MAPIAKVGGLGDVVTALARAIQDEGNLVEVILPKYQFFNASPMLGNMEFEVEFEALGTRIVVTKHVVEAITVFFVEPGNGMFNCDSVYGRNDDGVRFDFFCNAALEFLLQTNRQPDILHCHDWSTATVAASYWQNYHHNGLWKPKVVFTIHNMNYGQMKIGEACHHAQLTTTVSPSYAGEVSGHAAVRDNLHKFHGVRNGIDSEIWDPGTDQFLPMNYTAENHLDGKRRAREEIQQRFGLTWGSDQPMVAVVSRLTGQKGLDLIKHSIHHSLKRGAQFVLLGSAPDPKVQGDFQAMANAIGGPNAAFAFAFDEPLSHLVYAAADFVLVPSMFEPCGLTQMISMRYGAGKYFPPNTFRRLIAHTRLTLSFLPSQCRWCARRAVCATPSSTWIPKKTEPRGKWTAAAIGAYLVTPRTGFPLKARTLGGWSTPWTGG